MFDRTISIRNVMSREVITVDPLNTMDEVADIFEQENIHHLPVVKEGKVLGMISHGDLLQLKHHFTLFKSPQAAKMNSAILKSMLAKDVMSKPVVTISEDRSLEIAAGYFRENLFHAIPVVNHSKNLVGILTPYDLMNYAYNAQTTISE